jgi:xylan 1,4-beta-xylosidase
VLLDPGTSTEAGLTLNADDAAHHDVAVRGNEVEVRARCRPFDQVLARSPRGPGGGELEIETVDPAAPGALLTVAGPGTLRLGVRGQILTELDGRYLSTEVQDGFLGRVIGMYAVGADAAFDRFDCEQLRG